VVGWLTRLEQSVRLSSRFKCNFSVRASPCPVKPLLPTSRGLSFIGPYNRISGVSGALLTQQPSDTDTKRPLPLQRLCGVPCSNRLAGKPCKPPKPFRKPFSRFQLLFPRFTTFPALNCHTRAAGIAPALTHWLTAPFVTPKALATAVWLPYRLIKFCMSIKRNIAA
jgi:hypothetical protein